MMNLVLGLAAFFVTAAIAGKDNSSTSSRYRAFAFAVTVVFVILLFSKNAAIAVFFGAAGCLALPDSPGKDRFIFPFVFLAAVYLFKSRVSFGDLPLGYAIAAWFVLVLYVGMCFLPVGDAIVKRFGHGGGILTSDGFSTGRLEDLIGLDEFKARLLAAGREILTARGEHRNGILLHGAPGNGKTLFANALAGSLGIPLIELRVGEIESMWLGESIQRAQSVIDEVISAAPCLFFIDEADSFLGRRFESDRGAAASEHRKMVNLFLTSLVKFRSQRVVVVAATNFISALDPAVIREGRFDFKMEIPAPDAAARQFILRSALIRETKRLRARVQIDDDGLIRAATRWEGYAAARLTGVASEAATTAAKSQGKRIGFDELMTALRSLQGRKGRIAEGIPVLSDLVFPGEQKSMLERLAMRLKNMEAIEQMGGTVPSGLLFYGPPGTGKTLVAQSLAKTVDWAFLQVNGNELLRDDSRLDRLLDEAREIRPVIVFIDEADDILADRNSALSLAGGARSVTNKLLSTMDGAGGKPRDVLWVAATNHASDLDPAALRARRFELKIEFQMPGQDTLETMVRDWIGKSTAPFSPNARPDVIAGILFEAQANPADVSAVLQQAVNDAIAKSLETNTRCEVQVSDVQLALAQMRL
jgi:transitional endoplasmic reticulum ATPase